MVKIFNGNPEVTMIGIVADAKHSSVERPLNLAIKTAVKCDTALCGWVINHEPLLSSLSINEGKESIRKTLRKGHKVVVAMIGVSGSSSYEAEIHALLSAWKTAPAKPILLIASSNAPEAARAVDAWKGWKGIEELREAVLINKDYLVGLCGSRVLAQLKDSVALANALEAKLTVPVLTTPSDVVFNPSISGMIHKNHMNGAV